MHTISYEDEIQTCGFISFVYLVNYFSIELFTLTVFLLRYELTMDIFINK